MDVQVLHVTFDCNNSVEFASVAVELKPVKLTNIMESESSVNRAGCGRQCCRFLVSELHYSKICLCYKDRKAFVFTPVS